MSNRSYGRKRITFNSPVVLGFTILCFAALLLNQATGGTSNRLFFSTYRSSLLDPLTYVRMFGHVIGHANWSHFSGNIMFILLIGPLLEEKYGSANLLFVMAATALATGILHVFLFPATALLGASGIVYAFILLSSFTSVKDGEIPLTFILISIIYIGGQIYDGIFVKDNISNLAHIIGGVIGGTLGYVMNKYKMTKVR